MRVQRASCNHPPIQIGWLDWQNRVLELQLEGLVAEDWNSCVEISHLKLTYKLFCIHSLSFWRSRYYRKAMIYPIKNLFQGT